MNELRQVEENKERSSFEFYDEMVFFASEAERERYRAAEHELALGEEQMRRELQIEARGDVYVGNMLTDDESSEE